MIRSRSWASLLGALLVCTPAGAATNADRYRGADELAARIDQLLDKDWKKDEVVPARPADDAEWLRRVYLDVAGRIPSVTEARTFLGDRRSDRRTRLVESLLASQRYPTWFASVWRGLLLPEANSTIQFRLQGPTFERWLRNWVASDRGYDALVRDLLTAPSGPPGQRGIGGAGGPALFFAAKENKPEEIAAAVSRLFLGVNLGCAQCHNHPFAEWKKDQFWSFAAFFSNGQNANARRGAANPRGERVGPAQLRIPGTDKVVRAKYLDGKEPSLENGSSPRQVLVDWMTAADNPYFARALANRLWAHFFGQGLMEPIDEMVGTGAQPSHPAVLDELARAFAARKHDLRWLVRAITATKAYQLSSARSHTSQDEPKHFARMALRTLNAEQLYDSLALATGLRVDSPAGRARIGIGIGGPRDEFLTKFGGTERPTEAQTSILQALTLMNGRVMATATSSQRSEYLMAVVDAPFLDVPGKIETLYLAALSRKPSSREIDRLVRYVEKAGADDTRSANEQSRQQADALADVFWALLNSAEFVINH
jgi:hypothetical protein